MTPTEWTSILNNATSYHHEEAATLMATCDAALTDYTSSEANCPEVAVAAGEYSADCASCNGILSPYSFKLDTGMSEGGQQKCLNFFVGLINECTTYCTALETPAGCTPQYCTGANTPYPGCLCTGGEDDQAGCTHARMVCEMQSTATAPPPSPPPAPPALEPALDFPQTCTTFPDFNVFADIVTTVCCSEGVVCPPGGMPTACTADCATVLLPMQRKCGDFLALVGMAATVDEVIADCPAQCPAAPVDTRPAECIEADDAERCRGWGFHWDEVRKTCTAGGH
jgi:hypothetical protein